MQSAIIFFLFFIIIIIFFFFMSLPGRQIYIFLTLIFFFLCPFRGIKFFFLTSKKLYHMKFAIFDVARCRMSATSLTFWFIYPSLSHPNPNPQRNPSPPIPTLRKDQGGRASKPPEQPRRVSIHAIILKLSLIVNTFSLLHRINNPYCCISI